MDKGAAFAPTGANRQGGGRRGLLMCDVRFEEFARCAARDAGCHDF